MAEQDRGDDPTGDGGTPWVRPLAAFGRDDVPVAGGKAANLGELVRAGLPVPDGFVVTTAAYDDVVHTLDLRSAILALVPAADPSDGSDQDTAYATAADAIAGWLSRDQARELHDQVLALRPGATIVEIGSHHGRSTVVLAGSRPDVRVVAIDPDPDTPPTVEGTVTAQQPEAGTRVPAGEAVTIWVEPDSGGGGGGGNMPRVQPDKPLDGAGAN